MAKKPVYLPKKASLGASGKLPDEKLLAAMGKYNEELVKAGVMLAGEGLHPSTEAEVEIRQVFRSRRFRRRVHP